MSLPVAGVNPFGWVKDQVLGGLEWGVDQAAGFVTNLLAGIADALIPDWLAREALNFVAWTVSIPNYAAGGDGAGGYAFGGVNTLRGVLTWVGVTLIPLTLTVAIGRATLGVGQDHPIVPFTRALSSIALVVLYPFVWAQLATGANQLTRSILRIPAVQEGLNEQFEFMVGGGALKGVPMLGALMLLVAAALLIGLIVLKLMVLVAGALLYVTGVLMPGIAATERGQAVTQAWITATVGLLAIPVVWTVVFAIGALLINDADTAAAAVGGSGKLKELIGGLMLAVGSIAATAIALKIGMALGSVVISQVGGALTLAGGRGGAGGQHGAVRAAATGATGKLAAFGDRVSGALRNTAGSHLTGRTRTGALAALAGGGALARGGMLGAASAGGRRALSSSAQATRRLAQRTPAGVVASRVAASARAGWQNPGTAPRVGTPPNAKASSPAPAPATAPAGSAPSPSAGATDQQPVAPRPATGPPPPPTGSPPSADPARPTSRPPQSPPAQPRPPRNDHDSKGNRDADVPPTR